MLPRFSLISNLIKGKSNVKMLGEIRCINVWTSDNIAKSPYMDVDIPELTVPEYMWRNLDKWATKPAVVCGITKRQYTYEQLHNKCRTFAANLRKRFRIKNGDVVSVILPNMPEYPIICFGILEAGGVVTTMNPIYTAYEIQRQIILSETKLIVAHSDTVSTIKEAIQLAKTDIPIIVVDTETPRPESTISFKELMETGVDLDVLKQVNRSVQDDAFLPYSSGTTGLPKGVRLTHRNIVANCHQQSTECMQYNETTGANQDTVSAVLPMFHSYGLGVIMLQKLSAGLRLVTMPRFQTEVYLNSLLEFKTDLLYLAPPMVMMLGSHPNSSEKHFENISWVMSGGAPLPEVDIHNLVRKANREIEFSQGYGLTETSPLCTLGRKGFRNYTAVGYALPNIEMRIVDGEDKNLGPNEIGELLIKGPNVMKGYKNNPEANSKSFLEDGWFRSGDLVKIAEDGELTIVDRLKELIKVKGYQVPPAELESVIKEHPAVSDAAVVGIPDPIAGERPRAFVVLKTGLQAKDSDIMSFVHPRVAPYKKLKEVMFIEQIPKNASGKILRKELRQQYC